MMIEFTFHNGKKLKKLLVNSDYLLTVREADNGHSMLRIAGYEHSIEVTQSIETIKTLLQ